MENIILDSTKTLQIELDTVTTTNPVDITVSYVDVSSSGALADGAQETHASSAPPTLTTILGSPTGSPPPMRNALTVTVVNNDTVQHIIKIYKVTGAGNFLITEQTLAAGTAWDSNINNYLFDWAAAINNATAGTANNASKIGFWDVFSGALRSITLQNLILFIETQISSVFMPFIPPGTSGNVLTSNGSLWTSAAPSGGWRQLVGGCKYMDLFICRCPNVCDFNQC